MAKVEAEAETEETIVLGSNDKISDPEIKSFKSKAAQKKYEKFAKKK